MSKKLFIYRHAKSDWDADYNTDHERPLAQRGIKSAAVMGRLLAASGQVPQLVVTSSALRARQTLEHSIQAGSWNCDIVEDDSLYYGGEQAALQLIQSLPDSISSVMLVGHEPKWSTITSTLIGGGDVVFKTAVMARIDFEVESWKRVDAGAGSLRWLIPPSFFLKGNFSDSGFLEQ